MSIVVQLKVLRGSVRREAGLRGDAAVEQAALTIVDKCLAGCAVMAPDLVSAGDWGQRPGTFGVTEPFPGESG